MARNILLNTWSITWGGRVAIMQVALIWMRTTVPCMMNCKVRHSFGLLYIYFFNCIFFRIICLEHKWHNRQRFCFQGITTLTNTTSYKVTPKQTKLISLAYFAATKNARSSIYQIIQFIEYYRVKLSNSLKNKYPSLQ